MAVEIFDWDCHLVRLLVVMFQLSVVFVVIVLYRHTTAKTLPEITFKVDKYVQTNPYKCRKHPQNVTILIKLSRS